MKREEVQRMLSQVDEKYISEITESGTDSEIEYADEVSGEVEVVTHISHWRNWAAAAAALIVCVGLGAALIRPAMQRSQFQVADSAGCYDFIDSLTEEELDKYFLNEIENLPDFPITETSFTSRFGNLASAVGKNLFDTMNVAFSETHDCAEISTVNPEIGAVIARVWDNAPELDFSQAEAYHIDEYDVDFYGAYFQAVSEPMPASQSFFSYHGKLYNLYTDTLSKKETIRLVYEILDSDFSAKKLWLEYGMSDEDFIPYFTYAKPDVSNLTYYKDDYYFDSQYGEFTLEVNNAVPPFRKNQFDTADYIWFNENSDRKARTSMHSADNSVLLTVYDNIQIDMNDFITLSPYHLDDYDIDFYGLYKTHDTPIKCSTACVFRYHDRLYVMTATNFTRQETMKLVYEILDSDISAESLYQQYCGDFVSAEDSRTITLEKANELEFCKGMIPQLDTLTGENEQSNGRNLGMDGEYIYDSLYDDSDLHLKKDTIGYYRDENGEQLSYSYSNAECYLHITYTSFLPDNAHLAEHYSPKITLNEPFSTLAENQDENSRLRNWDFWLDLGSCYVHLDGHCSMNQEDSFVNGLNNIIVGQQQETEDKSAALEAANQMELCKNLVPQMVTVGDMHFDKVVTALTETDPIKSVEIQYADDTMTKGFIINYSDMDLALADIAVPVLTTDQITEEGLTNAGIFTEYQGFFIDCQQCLIDISFTNCTKEEMMPYLTELKNLIETYDSENTDLQQFNQNKLWGGLVPELQKIGSLEFQGISLVSPDDADALNYQVLYQEQNNPEHKLAVTYSYGDNVQSIVSAKLGILDAVPVYGGDGNQRIFEFHAGKFFIEIETIGCTQEEIDTYLTETEKLLNKNYHASGAILEYLNQQEAFRNGIPEISQMNQLKFYSAVTNLTLDENAPEIEIHYVNEENLEQKLFCKFTKNPKTEATPLTIEEIDGNLQIEPGKYEHFELFVDCHGWYAWIVGENCYKEDLDGYTMALAETYNASH